MPPNNLATLEVCIDDAAGLAACQADADRIELCSALSVGGLTPAPGLIAAARSSRVPVHAMIRPRIGTFDFSDADQSCALSDIAAVKAAGLAGVVLGATRGDALDLATLTAQRDAAAGLDCTLHRAIDLLGDPVTAMEQVIALGFVRILTSGGAPKAVDGLARLRALHDAAAGRIEIMVGSGVSKANAALIAAETGVRSFHASCASSRPAPAQGVEFGFAPAELRRTDAEEIAAFKQVICTL